MTVSNKVPIVEHTGNGVITEFQWDWDMIEDSTINVLVDNSHVDEGWTLQGQAVIFTEPPEQGAFIQIYRRTKIWMPEDYLAFGRFHPDKTELSVDRATLIMQERFGNASEDEPPNGIVGGANLSLTRKEYSVVVNNERGEDAEVPMYLPDDTEHPVPPDPDPTIVWAGAALKSNTFGYGAQGISLTVKFDLDGNAYYPFKNVPTFVPWVDVDPNDNEYWMRVTLVSQDRQVHINDGVNPRNFDEAFPIAVGPSIRIDTYGRPAPYVEEASVIVEICKDDGTGLPDGGWVARAIDMVVRYNLEEETTPPPPNPETPEIPVGAISWDDFFGQPITAFNNSVQAIIGASGVAIWFQVPTTNDRVKIDFSNVEMNITPQVPRAGAVNKTVLDFTTPPTYGWGLGGGIEGWINPDVGDVTESWQTELNQGEIYIFNIKNDPAVPINWIEVRGSYRVQT